MLRLFIILLAAGLLVSIIWVVCLASGDDPVAFFQARRSKQLSAQELSIERRDGLVVHSLHLKGSGSKSDPDRAVEFKAYYCTPDSAEKLPAFVVLGGLITGRDAIDMIISRPAIDKLGSFIVLDYPWAGPDRFKGLQIIPWVPRIRQALFDGVEAIRLAVDYLEKQGNTDTSRIVLLGVSLGAFYAVDAGGVDPRPAAVLAFMGGGDLGPLISANMRRTKSVPGILSGPMGRLSAQLLQPLEPVELVGRIAPRPYIQVSATNDEMVSTASSQALWDASKEPHSLVWISTPHVRPGLDYIVDQLITIAESELRNYGLLR